MGVVGAFVTQNLLDIAISNKCGVNLFTPEFDWNKTDRDFTPLQKSHITTTTTTMSTDLATVIYKELTARIGVLEHAPSDDLYELECYAEVKTLHQIMEFLLTCGIDTHVIEDLQDKLRTVEASFTHRLLEKYSSNVKYYCEDGNRNCKITAENSIQCVYDPTSNFIAHCRVLYCDDSGSPLYDQTVKTNIQFDTGIYNGEQTTIQHLFRNSKICVGVLQFFESFTFDPRVHCGGDYYDESKLFRYNRTNDGWFVHYLTGLIKVDIPVRFILT